MKKKDFIILILILILFCLTSYILYDKFLTNYNFKNQKNYDINDYVYLTDFEINQNCLDCGTYGTIKKINFKNLPLRLITEFNSKHETFIYPSALETAKLNNEIFYEINNNVLSIFEKDIKTYDDDEKSIDCYSLNINLETEKIISNQELLKMYKVNPTKMFEKILNNIANTVSLDEILLTTDGDVTKESIKIDEFKANIKTYAQYIDNRYDVINLFIKDHKLYATYNQGTILTILGMGSHMAIGLVIEPQIVEIN